MGKSYLETELTTITIEWDTIDAKHGHSADHDIDG